MRLHQLRLDANASLKVIGNKAKELYPGGRKWTPNRVDEHLTAKDRPALPALAVRTALVELTHPDPGEGRQVRRQWELARRELVDEVNALTVEAAAALGEETAGKLIPSGDGPGEVPVPRRGRWAFLAISVLALVIVGAASAPIVPGAYTAHERFEQCITAHALSVDPDRGPARTPVRWLLPEPPADATRYTVRNQVGALQATVVFTASAQAARSVLDSNKRFYDEHGVFDNDFTVGDTTVVTPQVANAKPVARDCANGA